MSRPRSSVPAQCWADGPARMLSVSMTLALSVHRIGAMIANTSTPRVSTSPSGPTACGRRPPSVVSSSRSSVLPDPRARVEEREYDVDDGVHEQDTDAVHDDDGLHGRIVLVED